MDNLNTEKISLATYTNLIETRLKIMRNFATLEFHFLKEISKG